MQSEIIFFYFVVLPVKIQEMFLSPIYLDVSPDNGRQASSEKQSSGWKTNPE